MWPRNFTPIWIQATGDDRAISTTLLKALYFIRLGVLQSHVLVTKHS